MRAVMFAACLWPLLLGATVNSAGAADTTLRTAKNAPAFCEVRDEGQVTFRGPCLQKYGDDDLSRPATVITAGKRVYRFTDVAPLKGPPFRFNGNAARPSWRVSFAGRTGTSADFEDLHTVYLVPGARLSVEIGNAEDALGADRPKRTIISARTHRRERVGQCFETRVRTFEPGPGDITANETLLTLADGHLLVDSWRERSLNNTRVGDAIRLCVTKLPRNCPPGDTRGIDYRGFNKRTGDHWKIGDAEHLCGGA